MTAPVAFNRRQILAPGTVITASGQSSAMTLSSDAVATLNAYVTITAASGTTPSVTFGIAFDNDANSNNYPPVSYAAATTGSAQTTTGADVLVATATAPTTASDGVTTTNYYRITWTVSGTTPSFTIGALYTDN
jgi:hypothetical protein